MHKLICAIFFCALIGNAGGTNLSIDRLASCSNGTNPEFAVDGKRDGWFWEASLTPSPCWLEIDLGQEREVDEINLFMWWGDKRYYQYIIEISSDRNSWQEIIDERKNTLSSDAEGRKYKISPRKARFVRLTVTNNNINQGAHVREIEIYGK